MPSAPPREAPWWVKAFGPLYLTVYGHRDEAEARRYAPSIARLLGVGVGARVLDVACGEGRYARALSSLGLRVTGVDLSPPLLEAARAASADLPGSPTYLRGDMRSLPFAEQFDAAISVFTSFGYFDSRHEDLSQLEAARRALVPGGRFLVDVPNATALRAALVPESEDAKPPYLVRSRRRIDETTPDGPYVRKAIEIVDARTERVLESVEERVRLYEPDELDEALRRAGLEPVGERCGDLDGRPFDLASPRCVRVAEKPRRRPAA